MAKKKQQPKKQDGWKDARIKGNVVKRATRHTARMQEQKPCPKRGLARALRRYCDGVAKEAARVLTKHHNLASLVRARRTPKPKREAPLRISVNGKAMGSLAELAWTMRQLEQERAARAKGSVA